jgi:hypothetical protein
VQFGRIIFKKIDAELEKLANYFSSEALSLLDRSKTRFRLFFTWIRFCVQIFVRNDALLAVFIFQPKHCTSLLVLLATVLILHFYPFDGLKL